MIKDLVSAHYWETWIAIYLIVIGVLLRRYRK